MRGLALNILIAVVWSLFSGEVSLRELAVGFLVGLALLSLFPQVLGAAGYVQRSRGVLSFGGYFLRELAVANVQVATLALHRRPPLDSRIVAVPLRLRTELGQTLLAAIITLLPGTVALGFSADRRTLFAHAVGPGGTAAVRTSVLQVESHLLRLLAPSSRGEGLS